MRIFSRLNIGGPTLHVVNLSKDLARLDYDTVLVVGTVQSGEGDMGFYAQNQGIVPRVIDEFQAPVSPWRDLVAFVRLARLIRSERPDIVHTHTFKAGLLGRLAAKLNGVPVIVHTYHGHLLAGYWGKLKTFAVASVERALGLITDKVITVSEQVTADILKNKIVGEKKIMTVPLGFDLDLVRGQLARPPTLRARLGIPDRDKVVGIVGRFVPVKGLDLFLESLAPLLARDPHLHLALVGDGPERPALERLALRLCADSTGMRGRIHFAGWLNPMVSEYRDFDVCVCSSKNEGTSVAAIESVLCGVPVVSVDVGGMRDLLGNGRWGSVVPRDAARLRDETERTLSALGAPANDPARMALAARIEKASRHFFGSFDAKRLSRDIDRVYREISAL